MAINSERERLLCYASGVLCSTLSNPNNVYAAKDLIRYSIKTAHELIETIYDDEQLKKALEQS